MRAIFKWTKVSLGLAGLTLSLAACNNNGFQFTEVTASCTPPNSSARFGLNPGPIITEPAAGTPYNGTMTVKGTCVSGLDVTIEGAGVTSPVTMMCNNGAFETPVTFTKGDGNKEVDVSQQSVGDDDILDRQCFVQDTKPPAVKISGSSGSQAVNHKVVKLEGTCENGLTVSIDGPGILQPVQTQCNSGRFAASVTLVTADGLKNVMASQTDRAGNKGHDDKDYLTDFTPPVITIVTPSAMTPSQGSLAVTGRCEADLAVVLSGTGASGATRTSCVSGAYSATLKLGKNDGVKNIVASQTDEAGNIGTANRDFLKDTTAPDVSILSPANGAISTGSLSVSGRCEDGLDVRIFGDGLSSEKTVNCRSGAFSADLSMSAGDGLKMVMASQTDAAQNVGQDSKTYRRDNAGPVLKITAPAANTMARMGVTLQGVCETGYAVQISGSGVASSSSTDCKSGGKFSANIVFSNGDGNKDVTVAQRDAVGNSSTDSRRFIKDDTAPEVTIDSPAANSAFTDGVTLSGRCENGLAVILDGSGADKKVSAACSSGRYTANVAFSKGDGVKNITATQTDAVGNMGQASRNFVRDNSAPLVKILSPAAGTQAALGLTVSGSCESGLNVALSGDLMSTVNTDCTSGAFAAAVLFTDAFGDKKVTASQTDTLGNTGSDSRVFKRSRNAGSYKYTSKGPGGKVDILFVDDNSASMEEEQKRLGQRFDSFAQELNELDWQAGVTTTDCSTGAYGVCGSLLDFTGTKSYILKPSTKDFSNIFRQTIQRPETFDPDTQLSCIITNTCPSGTEEPLRALISAFNKRGSDNKNFFRDDAGLAVVILSDEDEMSFGPSQATKPADVYRQFKLAWPTDKVFMSYGIIIRPGDAACLKTQQGQFGGNAYYGTHAQGLADLTDGLTVSICDSDYSLALRQLGEDVRRLARTIELPQTPIPGTVSVSFNPAWTTKWTVSGNRLTFENPAPAGTKVEVYYEYK